MKLLPGWKLLDFLHLSQGMNNSGLNCRCTYETFVKKKTCIILIKINSQKLNLTCLGFIAEQHMIFDGNWQDHKHIST